MDQTTAKLPHGINILATAEELQSYLPEQVREAFLDMQAAYLATQDQLRQCLVEIQEERASSDGIWKALLIEHFRAKRLRQSLQDFHGADVAARIYRESAPGTKAEIDKHLATKLDLPVDQIIQEFEVLANREANKE